MTNRGGCHQESVDVNACDDFGWSPLMCAAGAGQSEAVTELLQRGADWRLADGKGRDARALAAAIGRHDVAEIINVRNCEKNSRLPSLFRPPSKHIALYVFPFH
jgi:ankyrin repeat protein